MTGKDANNTKRELMLVAPELRQEFERGLRFNHIMGMVNQEQSGEAVAYVQALADMLVHKGLLETEELEEALEHAHSELEKLNMPRVRLGDMGNKYMPGQAVEIDCASRINLCQARCCTFKFYLTKKDLEEGVARWDYGNPYWIKQGEDGYCTHSNPTNRFCTIHAKRPHTCRQYDCRNDKRIWLDFEQRIPAPLIERTGDAPVALAEVALQNSIREAQVDSEIG